jgi:hypothetical protein
MKPITRRAILESSTLGAAALAFRVQAKWEPVKDKVAR